MAGFSTFVGSHRNTVTLALTDAENYADGLSISVGSFKTIDVIRGNSGDFLGYVVHEDA